MPRRVVLVQEGQRSGWRVLAVWVLVPLLVAWAMSDPVGAGHAIRGVGSALHAVLS
jgi:hypothetical protein